MGASNHRSCGRSKGPGPCICSRHGIRSRPWHSQSSQQQEMVQMVQMVQMACAPAPGRGGGVGDAGQVLVLLGRQPAGGEWVVVRVLWESQAVVDLRARAPTQSMRDGKAQMRARAGRKRTASSSSSASTPAAATWWTEGSTQRFGMRQGAQPHGPPHTPSTRSPCPGRSSCQRSR